MMALTFKFTPTPIAMPRRSQEGTRGSVRLSTARPEETSSNGSARTHVLAAPNIRYTIAVQHTALGHSPRARPHSQSDQHQAGNRPARARNLRGNDAGAEQLHREAVEEKEHRPVRQPVQPGTLRVRIGRLPSQHHPAHRCHRRLDVIEIGWRGGVDDHNRHVRQDDAERSAATAPSRHLRLARTARDDRGSE